jgi:hypothetical protein
MITRAFVIARLAAVAACLAAGTSVLAQGPIASRKGLTLDGAKLVAAAATAEARRLNAGGAIAIVDEGGNLVYLERLDNTFQRRPPSPSRRHAQRRPSAVPRATSRTPSPRGARRWSRSPA